MYYLALIPSEKTYNNSFAWVASGQSPFKSIDPVDLDENIKRQVYALYRSVYKKIDKKLFIKKADALLKYNRWVLIIDASEKIIGFALFRDHAFGIKLGLVGSADTKEAKKAIIELSRKAFNVNSVFAEVSPPLENVLTGHVPEVSSTKAGKILGKTIIAFNPDKLHYTRIIEGLGEKEKMIVGKPLEKYEIF